MWSRCIFFDDTIVKYIAHSRHNLRAIIIHSSSRTGQSVNRHTTLTRSMADFDIKTLELPQQDWKKCIGCWNNIVSNIASLSKQETIKGDIQFLSDTLFSKDGQDEAVISITSISELLNEIDDDINSQQQEEKSNNPHQKPLIKSKLVQEFVSKPVSLTSLFASLVTTTFFFVVVEYTLHTQTLSQ